MERPISERDETTGKVELGRIFRELTQKGYSFERLYDSPEYDAYMVAMFKRSVDVTTENISELSLTNDENTIEEKFIDITYSEPCGNYINDSHIRVKVVGKRVLVEFDSYFDYEHCYTMNDEFIFDRTMGEAFVRKIMAEQ